MKKKTDNESFGAKVIGTMGLIFCMIISIALFCECSLYMSKKIAVNKN
ncbi:MULTISPECIES: hypothetical protein [Bacillus]|nr:hypothetical protein [Bacillus sp. UNC322MFChir4.1]